MNPLKSKKGFSLIEVLLAVIIISILIGLASTYYSNSQVRADISYQASNLVHYLRLAQSGALSGLNDSDQGIHFDETGYTLFEGSTYDEDEPKNVRKDLPESMTLSDIDLNGGDDVIFEKGSGETDNDGTVTLSAIAISRDIVITINSVGTINY